MRTPNVEERALALDSQSRDGDTGRTGLLRPKILLSAYACEPVKGSEPGVGWNWACQISQFAEVWVLTRENNRAPIERALAGQSMSNTHFVYYDLPRWMSFWKKGSRGVRAYYYFWQLGAYFVAKKLQKQISFDLIHHATFASCWFPSFLVFLPVPFLWGPVGGGESAPRSFRRSFGSRGKAYELFRDLSRLRAQCDPFVRATARRAAFALGTTPETEKELRSLGCERTGVLSLAAISDEEVRHLYEVPERVAAPFRILSTGRLLHWKGFHLGIEAFARFHRTNPDSEYWLIGDGPERPCLEKLACDLSIDGTVHFLGNLPRAKALERLADCDALLNPSLHDSSGWVSIEAMAAARPVICLDAGGLALQVDETNGIKVPAISPQQAVAAMAAALESLARAPDVRLRYGRASRGRVERDFNWARKSQQIREIFESIIGKRLVRSVLTGPLEPCGTKAELAVLKTSTLRSNGT